MYEPRKYRNRIQANDLKLFEITVEETNLLIHADRLMIDEARESVIAHRSIIKEYIDAYPNFGKTLSPYIASHPMPTLIESMAVAGIDAGVGPMAAVAGAVAESVAKDLLNYGHEVVVENGGDIYLSTCSEKVVGLFAGKSPLSLKLGIKIEAGRQPVSICTSSGTIGHSKSMGKSDAVCIVARSCALADAAATAVGNRICQQKDIKSAVEFGKNIPGVVGILIVIKETMAVWGDIEVVPLRKKG